MPNFDSFWELESVLVDFGIIDAWHLFVVHWLLVGMLFFLNLLIVRPVLRIVDKRLLAFPEWISRLVLGFSLVWTVIHGVIVLMLGDELSMARYLYVYLTLLVMIAISTIHIEISVPNYHVVDDSERGDIDAREAKSKREQ